MATSFNLPCETKNTTSRNSNAAPGKSGLKAGKTVKHASSQFSEIARDLLTPAALVLGPLEQIAGDTSEVATRRQAEIALRNAKEMLRSLRQVIDLQALQSGQLEMRAQRMEMIEFVREQVGRFNEICKAKNLNLSVSTDLETMEADFDPQLIAQALSKLLANAVKFSEEGGMVRVKLDLRSPESGMLRLSVQDSGKGIEESTLALIVDLFDHGEMPTSMTGMGLPLVKKIVDLHSGSVSVTSIEGLGTEIAMLLPIEQQVVHDKQYLQVAPQVDDWKLEIGALRTDTAVSQEWEANEGTGDLILLIEPSADLRDFIRLSLEPGFRVVEADNGPAGLDAAVELKPDVILSAMYPGEISGIELCAQLREEALTAHIPVILLSEDSSSRQVEALEAGADACLDRHLNVPALRAHIQRLLDSRKQLQKYFRTEMIAFSPVTGATSQEDQFLSSLRNAMAENLTDENFSVEDLAAEMAMSRTQLHRRLKAIADQSASTFMRNYRLERAHQLLEQNVAGVGEVAFMVGFGTASYFSKAFTAKYGVSPKEIRKRTNLGTAKQMLLGELTPQAIRISA